MKGLIFSILMSLANALYAGPGVNLLYEGGSGPWHDGSWIYIAITFIAGGILFWGIAGWIIHRLGWDDDTAISVGGFVGGVAWLITFLAYYEEITRAGAIIILCGIGYFIVKSFFFDK